jgi:hypothetical protein
MPWLAPLLLLALSVWAIARGSWQLGALAALALLVNLYVTQRRGGWRR